MCRRLENFVQRCDSYHCRRFHRVTCRTIAVSTNTNRRLLMSESYSLPTEPEGMDATLIERFNSGKVSAMMGIYAPEAVFIAKDGRTISDHAEIASELERDLRL